MQHASLPLSEGGQIPGAGKWAPEKPTPLRAGARMQDPILVIHWMIPKGIQEVPPARGIVWGATPHIAEHVENAKSAQNAFLGFRMGWL